MLEVELRQGDYHEKPRFIPRFEERGFTAHRVMRWEGDPPEIRGMIPQRLDIKSPLLPAQPVFNLLSTVIKVIF